MKPPKRVPVLRILITIFLSLWFAHSVAGTQRNVSKHFPVNELEQAPYTVTFSFFATATEQEPYLVEAFYADELEWEESGKQWKVTAKMDSGSIHSTQTTWYEVAVDSKQIGGRQKLMGIDPNVPDFSVEGYIETRAGGIKFADQTLQTTAVTSTNFQQRVTDSCPVGSSIASINQDGSVSCQNDTNSGGDITGVTAGSGLTGGGTSGTVSIAVDTSVVQQRVATSCPAGQSIRTINQNGSVVCIAGGSNPTPPLCNGTNQALQWDGSQYTCVDIRQLGASAGSANGFELTDAQNETWDGFQRPKLNWADAKLACETLGGRLPTITELYRNNANSGSGNLANPGATDYHWTLIAGQTGYHAAVRLNDGQVSNNTNNSLLSYRCVWPDVSDDLFTANNCYTSTGSCEQTGLIWNLDEQDRAPMNYQNAVNECNFYGATVPGLRDMSEYIHQTMQTNSNTWTWASNSKYWHSNNMGMTLYRWSQKDPSWAYAQAIGSLAAIQNYYAVRCIGKNQPVGQLPTPACTGGCFQLDQRRARILSDNADRPATNYAAAAESCRSLGGSLPDTAELTDLIHAGLVNGTDNWLWSSSPLYWYSNNYGTLGYKWAGTGADDWTPLTNSTITVLASTGNRPYRCIWNEKLEATATVCAANEVQQWNGNQFTCAPSVIGTSGGSASPSEFVDAWGNAWDSGTQTATDFAAAAAYCDGTGARLPTATEVYRLRANQAVAGVTPIGTAIDTAYLWTSIVGNLAANQLTIRVSDGSTTTTPTANNSAYRCIWPATKGDVLAGRSCYSEPANGCYQSGDLRTDNFDRPAMPQASASNECEFYGGRLPDLDEFQELIHSGAANGSDNWLWINEPIYWYNGGYGYAMGKWVGTGDASWLYNSASSNAFLGTSNGPRAFRCIFSNRMN